VPIFYKSREPQLSGTPRACVGISLPFNLYLLPKKPEVTSSGATEAFVGRERINHKKLERINHKTLERINHKTLERISHKTLERIYHKTLERIYHKTSEKINHKILERINHKTLERMIHKTSTCKVSKSKAISHVAARRIESYLQVLLPNCSEKYVSYLRL
jgi:hypothetical protein